MTEKQLNQENKNEGVRPIIAKVKCPHCEKEIEIVIAGMAMLPSDSTCVRFEMTWIEH